jgi:hypothetical protein
MKFDLNPDLTMGKQVSISHPEGWAKGGDYDTGKQGVKPQKAGNFVTTGGSQGGWASGGPQVSVGKQSVQPAKPGTRM